MRWCAAGAFALGMASAATFCRPAAAQSEPAPSPSPVATPTPRPNAPRHTAAPLRHATNLCDAAPLYTWSPTSGYPTPANIRPANFGERFEIQEGPRRSLNGDAYYLTTIPVVYGTGQNRYYWVSERCFNPS